MNHPFAVNITMEGYTLINWAIPPDRLASVLPTALQLATTPVMGTEMAWLSIFVGRNIVHGAGLLPLPPTRFDLVNYRTYVRSGDGRSLYIFRSIIGRTLFWAGAKYVLQLPAIERSFVFEAGIEGDRVTHVAAAVEGELAFQIEATGQPPETPGFADASAAVAFLGNVPEAFYSMAGSCLGRMLTSHPPLQPDGGRLLMGAMPWLVNQGLLTAAETAAPASIFLQGRVPFPTWLGLPRC